MSNIEKNIKDYKRVTETLAPFSGLKDIPKHIVDNAAIRGTEVHEYCDATIEGIEILKINEEWRGYLNSFLLWEKGKNFLTKPDRLFCDKYMISGKIDGLYKEGNDIILFDLKTPLKESKTWDLQLSAYAYLLEKNGINVSRIQAVKLDKNGEEPKVFEYKIDYDSYFECLGIYNKFFKTRKEDDLYLDYL